MDALSNSGPAVRLYSRGRATKSDRIEDSVMRKVNVLEFVSLDGVIQAPGGPEEDTSGGFAYGGWISPHSDAVVSTVIKKQMNMPFDLLIGRKTFDMWAPFWPKHSDIWPAVNTATKYVASNTMTSHEWQPSVFLNGDIAGKISKIKQQEGPDLHVYGSANLLQTLLKHDLVDGTDRTKMLGAVVGKALEPLRQGTAVIQVLVTLQ